VFALDVPSTALLILPPDGKVIRAVYDLRKLGVNAFPFDLSTSTGGRSHLLRGSLDTFVDNPALLVSTAATLRGVDLPELSHMCICLEEWAALGEVERSLQYWRRQRESPQSGR
jgi:hypothetical protein